MNINAINSFNEKTSFGLNIKMDKHFNKFIDTAKMQGATNKSIAEFIRDLSKMSITTDGVNSTSIAFRPIEERVIKVTETPIIDEGLFFDTFVGTDVTKHTGKCLDYLLSKQGQNHGYTCILNNKSLKEILRDIAKDYADFFYRKG